MAEKYFAQPSGTSAQQHFSAVPKAEIERSTFDRSHGYKTTFNAGGLVPVYVDEVLPGDSFRMNSTAFCRLATPLKPIMDNLYLDTHYFFVPYRLVWANWEKFCGEKTDPTDTTVYTIPTTLISMARVVSDDIASYMGIPHHAPSANVQISALPFRAYTLIYNDWYRDQNLQAEIAWSNGDTGGAWTGVKIATRNKRHDYFTSALPWPQKGSPVFVPLGTSAPVQSTGITPHINIGAGGGDRKLQAAAGFNIVHDGATTPAQTDFTWQNPTGLYTDLTAATAITINDLRTAFQIQRLLERDARGGSRYIEIVLSHFGVHSDDARLQRPEYLGGGTAMVNINPIASTLDAVPLEGVPLGTLGAFGTVVGKAHFEKSFTEHGIIIGIASVRSDLTYQQGIERFWSRRTRYDFYWPALAHLGEQSILSKELYWTGIPANDDAVFGYQERYAEYRYKPSRITGKFSSNDPNSLDVWHLAQDFGTGTVAPTLNFLFVAEAPPMDRVIAVPSEPDFLMDMWFSLQCTRPMPTYSVPGLIDHF